MNEGALLELCDILVQEARRAGADQAEAALAWSRATETHLENNDIHTVQRSEETTFGLRVVVGNSLGFVTANDTDTAALRTRAEEAVAQARVTPADEFNGLPDPQPLLPVARIHDPEIEAVGAGELTELAGILVDRVRSRDGRVRIDSGSIGATASTVAIASSTGVRAAEASTSIDGYLFGMAVDGDEVASFDYDGDSFRSLAPFSAAMERAADRFVDKCLAGLGATSGESFKGSVILAPDAVAEFLLPAVVAALCADVVRKGRSPLADKLGESIAATGFCLIDDGSLPGGAASSAFDRDGLPVRRREIIAGGELRSYLYNYYESRATGGEVASTGHASGPVSALPSIGPTYLELAAGATPSAAMVGAGERAVLVNRFSGSTNPVTGDFSGVAKNGYLMHGSDRRPIKEVLVAGNVFAMLKSISAISAERRLIGGTRLMPALRVENVSVTAG